MTLLGAVGCALTFAPVQSFAQEKKNENAAAKSAGSQGDEKKAPNPNRALPFRGTVAAVDKSAKTVKVGTRFFHVTAETKLQKDNKAATLDDVVVGEPIRGSYRQAEDGKLNAMSLSFGPKAADPQAEGEKPAAASEKPVKKQLKGADAKPDEKVPE